MKYASLVFPVVDDTLYLGMRGTNPHMGKFGPIGGKADPGKARNINLVETHGGHAKISVADQIAIAEGRESPIDVGLRELAEELYQRESVQGLVSDVYNLGAIEDRFEGKEFGIYIILAKLNSYGFNPNRREIMQVRPIAQVDPNDIFPIGKAALDAISYQLETFPHPKLEPFTAIGPTLPRFPLHEMVRIMHGRNSSIIGLAGRYGIN